MKETMAIGDERKAIVYVRGCRSFCRYGKRNQPSKNCYIINQMMNLALHTIRKWVLKVPLQLGISTANMMNFVIPGNPDQPLAE